ncbi:hypothetical protein C9F11_16565 [Streptomyces sp. YIM 121038]|nr:hypothetical protein C9F11_16565 [Streptomyces sp. YIM 121038]
MMMGAPRSEILSRHWVAFLPFGQVTVWLCQSMAKALWL